MRGRKFLNEIKLHMNNILLNVLVPVNDLIFVLMKIKKNGFLDGKNKTLDES
jgi:hypothetical protein